MGSQGDFVTNTGSESNTGTAQAQVEVGQTKSVSISCHVGNALVSVMFGRDEAERQAFDEMYDDYGLLIKIGQHSMAITRETEDRCLCSLCSSFRIGLTGRRSFR